MSRPAQAARGDRVREWRRLAEGLGRPVGPDPGTIAGIAYDSRRVAPGDAFVALPGQKDDGHRYVGEALARGAAALVVEREEVLPPGAAGLIVRDSRRALAELAARFYDYPSREMGVVAVTGTNGKTTTAFLACQALSPAGRAGLVGTVWTIVGGKRREAGRTTPEAPDLQRVLALMRAAGDRFAVLEASSEGLAQDRAHGLDVNVAVFTNLSQDHLNFHGTMERYFAAKARLFDMLAEEPEGGHGGGPRLALVCVDDAWGVRLARRCRAKGIPTATYSAPRGRAGTAEGEGRAPGDERPPDVRAEEVSVGPESLTFVAIGRPGGRFAGLAQRVWLPLGGRFNVANALAALLSAVALGVDPEAAARALAEAEPVPGRFERVRMGQPFSVLVDYAHTPDGLENVLRAAREVTAGRLLVVFGCGGDRDRGKRPEMGRIAAELADLAVLTSDNPRSEDPERILDEIAAGVPAGRRAAVRREADRRRAIAAALALARPGDTVVVAGKGHEAVQVFRDGSVPFDDRDVAREELRRLGWGGA